MKYDTCVKADTTYASQHSFFMKAN